MEFLTSGAILNDGSLTLENVTLQGLNLPSANASLYTGFISSAGSLILRNVTVANVNQQAFTDITSDDIGAVIDSFGNLEIYNSSFINNSANAGTAPLIAITSNSVVPSITISNSLFANNKSPVCNFSSSPSGTGFKSLGGNTTDDVRDGLIYPRPFATFYDAACRTQICSPHC